MAANIHGNWKNVARYLRFVDYYSNYFDDLINTGDTVTDKFSDGIDGYAAIEGAEKILMVPGNHDTATKSGSTYNWQGKVGVDAYNAFIAPFVSNWGVTQPEGAAENGYCYYYKDYTAKGIRLICVDIMGYDTTEDTWLQGVLADALESGLHVLIATHYAGARPSAEASEAVFNKLACNYTTLYALGSSSTNLTSYNTSAYKMMDSVDAFMQSGGHFCGYIQGHYHADFIAKVGKYPGQLIYSIGSSKASEVRDYSHAEGSRMQDEFQVVAVDTVNTIVKLFKVGANYDRYGRSKGSVCVDYSTGEILGEGYY